MRYTEISLPRSEVVVGLSLLRVATREIGRALTYDERNLLERFEAAVEGRDRRRANRFPKMAPRPRVELNLLRRAQ